MASMTVTADELVLNLTPQEKFFGLHGDIRVPLSAVREVTVEDDALKATRGIRAPGLAWPGLVKIGTWRGRGFRQFVVARKGIPGVRIALEGAGPDELLVSMPEAARVAEDIRAHTSHRV
jgi:hypothetical protein